MKIVVSGSIAYDYLMTFPGRFTDQIIPEKLTRLSVSFLVDDMVRQRGGTAANIAYSLKLLGGDPILFGTVGQDFGDYATWLSQARDPHRSRRRNTRQIHSQFFCQYRRRAKPDRQFLSRCHERLQGRSRWPIKGLPTPMLS